MFDDKRSLSMMKGSDHFLRVLGTHEGFADEDGVGAACASSFGVFEIEDAALADFDNIIWNLLKYLAIFDTNGNNIIKTYTHSTVVTSEPDEGVIRERNVSLFPIIPTFGFTWEF